MFKLLVFPAAGMASPHSNEKDPNTASGCTDPNAMCKPTFKKNAPYYIDYNNGFKFYPFGNKAYWVKINNLLKVDEIIASPSSLPLHSRVNGISSHSCIRSASTTITGGLNHHLSYSLKLFWANKQRIAASLKYTDPSQGIAIYAGQLLIPFGLEHSSSPKWLSFMDKSLPTLMFIPQYGMGIGLRKYGSNITFSSSLTNSDYHGHHLHRNVPLHTSFRFTYSPLHTQNEVIHFGGSAQHQDLHHLHSLCYSPKNELQHPDIEKYAKIKIPAKHATLAGLEAAYLYGPLTLQAEYTYLYLKSNTTGLSSRQLQGAYLQGSYILTGESRAYDFKSGTFGCIEPDHDYGAFELALRWSHLNLGTKKSTNLIQSYTIALNWIISPQVKMMGNYVHGTQNIAHRGKKHVDIVGMRLQFIY